MSDLHEVKVTFTGDTSSINKAFRDVDKAADVTQRRMDRLASQMQTAGRAMTLGITTPLLAAAGVVTKKASEMEESLNAVKVVFGEAGDSIIEFGKTAAQEVGLSALAVQKAAVPLGAALQNVGFDADTAADATVTLMRRAADMASVFDTDVEDALGAIQSALRGEADAIERFGVTMTAAEVKAYALRTGLVAAGVEMTAQETTVARLGALFEQTSQHAGDFANTAESLGNSSKTLRSDLENVAVELGTELIPVAKEIVGVLQGMLDRFKDLSPEMQTTLIRVGGVSAALGPMLLVIGKLIPAVRLLFTSFTLAAGPMGLVATAIAGVVAGVVMLAGRAREAREEQALLTSAVDGTAGSVETYKQALDIANEKLSEFNDTNLDAMNALKVTPEQEAVIEAYRTFGDVASGTAQDIDAIKDVLEAANEDLVTDNIVSYSDAVNALGRTYDQLGAGLLQGVALQEKHNQLTGQAVAIEANYEKAIDERAAIQEEAAAEMEATTGAHLDAIAALQEAAREEEAERQAAFDEAAKERREAQIQAEEDAHQAAHDEQIRRIAAITTARTSAQEAEALALNAEVAAFQDAMDAQTAAAQKAADEQLAIAEKLEEDRRVVLQHGLDFFQSLGKLLVQSAGDNAQKAFAIEQAFGVTQTIINTAVAITKALAELGPIAGPIAAIAIAAKGAIETALILSQTPPPKMAEGGIVLPRPGGTLAQLGEAGDAEAVIPLNDESMARLSDRIVDAMGRSGGRQESGAIDLTIQLGDRELYRALAKANRDGRFLVDQTRGLAARRGR